MTRIRIALIFCRPLFALLALAAGLSARADVTMPAIFGDHMVLQRDATVPVWGQAAPDEEVSVSIAGQTQTTRATATGDWMVKFSNLQAAKPDDTAALADSGLRTPDAAAQTPATPAAAHAALGNAGVSPADEGRPDPRPATTLTIRGKNTIVINDVLIGEVWLGSGQSNMVLSINRGVRNPAAVIADANRPRIRLFTEESYGAGAPQRTGKGKWVLCTPETIPEFSATLYFFGIELQRALQVPVGLILSARGGTRIESWIDYDQQKKIPGDKPYLKTMVENFAAATKAGTNPAAKAGAKGGKGKASKPTKQQLDELKAAREGPPGGLFYAKICPLIPFAIRGLLWYQGEANTQPECAPYYGRQLQLLVTDWRARWGYDFPAAWAQLPRYSAPGRDWPRVREGQLNALALPNTGMAILIDTGDKDNIHPADKIEVGHRLALWALGTVYNKPVPATSGPLPAGHEIRANNANEIVVRFTHADGGLVSKDGAQKNTPRGFVIAGADKQWKPAQARIDGDAVIISSPEVPAPVAARYGWENYPDCNLSNAAGLPASPFRTDDWE